jgi:hypothetical protein
MSLKTPKYFKKLILRRMTTTFDARIRSKSEGLETARRIEAEGQRLVRDLESRNRGESERRIESRRLEVRR